MRRRPPRSNRTGTPFPYTTLVRALHCYARTRLESKYPGEGSVDGMLPAHLMGNMWQQDWSNLWDVLEPYPDAGSLNVTGALKKQYEASLNEMLVKQNVMLDTDRSEERRAGKEGVSTCSTRW